VLSIAALFGLLIVSVAWQPAAADSCNPGMPSRVGLASGYLFVGTYLSHTGETRQGRPPTWTFRIDRVFAGGDAP
jgi:hypothetical protein